MRSREVVVKLAQDYISKFRGSYKAPTLVDPLDIAEKDVLELNVSQSHVKPSSTIKVSWKLAPSFKCTYKEVLAIANVSVDELDVNLHRLTLLYRTPARWDTQIGWRLAK